MDLMESFDRALEGGPAHRPIEDRLIVGRQAARRRRTATGAVALATGLVLGGVGWAVLPLAQHTADGSVATGGANTPEPTRVSEGAHPSWEPLYGYDYFTGEITTAPGVTIKHEVDDPIGRPRVKSSAAIVTYEGKIWWVMAAQRWDEDRGAVPSEADGTTLTGWDEQHEATSTRSFEQWVHEMDVLNTDPMFHTDVSGDWYEPGWVTIGEDGVLTAHKGAAILEQSSPARLDQAPEGVPSATATIEVDGARLCVIARILDEPVQGVVYLAESEYPGCGDAVIGYPYESAP